MSFTLHTIETAPEASQSQLEGSLKDFGMIPNLHAVMAEAPKVLEAYKTLHNLFQQSSFNNEELTVIWQTINVEHNCHYCIPAHAGVAQMMKVDPAISTAIRNGAALENEKLQVLHETTLALIKDRGLINKEIAEKFYAQGYKEQQMLEIILGISQKIMSNYINHLADTPVDKMFQSFV